MHLMRDLHSISKQVQAIMPAAIGANATKTGRIVDRAGYEGVEFIVAYGNVTTTGSVVTAVLFEGDATGSMTSVADTDLLGTEALASLPASAARTSGTTKIVSKRLGYLGLKRYVRLDLVQTGTTSAGCVAADALMFSPRANLPSNP